MNNSTINGIVWYNTFSRAEEEVDKIVQSYINLGYKIVRESRLKDHRIVQFSNGDKWQTKRATDNARGYKCNISYIDECIGWRTIRNIIGPCTISSPFQAFNYY